MTLEAACKILGPTETVFESGAVEYTGGQTDFAIHDKDSYPRSAGKKNS